MSKTMVERGGHLVAGLIILGALALAGCLEADTRGGEEPDEVVIQGTPTWDNGIGELLQLKCGVCHSVPPNKISPEGIPQTFDLNVQTTRSDGVLGAQDILTSIQFVVAEGIMPKEQATPLTDGEKSAIQAWDGS